MNGERLSNFQIELLAAFMAISSPFEMSLLPLSAAIFSTFFQMQITRNHLSCRPGPFRMTPASCLSVSIYY